MNYNKLAALLRLTGCLGVLLGLVEVFVRWREASSVGLNEEELLSASDRLPLAIAANSSSSSTCGAFTAWVPARVVPAVVLQVVSDRYIDVQRNFVHLMERNSGFTRENLYLVCMGREALEILVGYGIRCVPVTQAEHFAKRDIWKLRLRVLRCLLEAGHDVIMSDSDALWLKDPLEYLSPTGGTPTKTAVGSRIVHGGSSIVASRGRFPRDLAREWGSTMCMGFVLFRATGDSMRSFQAAMSRIVTETEDDQVAINIAARDIGIVWDPHSDMRYTASNGFGYGVIPGVGGGGELAVTLLPHEMFTRVCDRVPISSETIVAHCRSKKKAGAKRSWMKAANLWIVDHDHDDGKKIGETVA